MNRRPSNNPIENLLKAPANIALRIENDDSLPLLAARLFLWGLAFHAVYGFAMALFGSTEAAFMTAGKAPLVALCSAALCMPSLYVFSCVAGMPIRITQALALAGVTLAMTGLLLLGLTPVTWLFSVSTNSVPFVVIMNLTAWTIAVSFSFRFFGIFNDSRDEEDRQGATGLKWWLVIYIIVSLQMATTMRPLLTIPEQGWRVTEKKFFLGHFSDSMKAPFRDNKDK